MIYDLDAAEVPQTSQAAPICVIGGGIAGLFAAKKIADARELVVVIESGGLKFDPSIAYSRTQTYLPIHTAAVVRSGSWEAVQQFGVDA